MPGGSCFDGTDHKSSFFSQLFLLCYVCDCEVRCLPWHFCSLVQVDGWAWQRFLTVDIGAPARRSPAVGVHWRVAASWFTLSKAFQPFRAERLPPVVSFSVKSLGKPISCVRDRSRCRLRCWPVGRRMEPCMKSCAFVRHVRTKNTRAFTMSLHSRRAQAVPTRSRVRLSPSPVSRQVCGQARSTTMEPCSCLTAVHSLCALTPPLQETFERQKNCKRHSQESGLF